MWKHTAVAGGAAVVAGGGVGLRRWGPEVLLRLVAVAMATLEAAAAAVGIPR